MAVDGDRPRRVEGLRAIETVTDAPSYRRLFAVEGMPRLVASMLIARTASQMVALVLVLFALDRYGSAAIAGTVTFLSIAPGLVVSPIAGALLDRYGRTRLVIADYIVAAAALGLIALLAALDRLPVPALLAIVTVASLTFPLSTVGIRTLFPLIVPRPLWERANAIDSNGYVLSSVVGPALAGTLVATLGGELALATTAAIFGLAAVVTIGLRDPATRRSQGRLLADAWAGVVYVARNPTLRGLALSVSTANVAWGLFFIALPVLVIERLGQGPAAVGQLFALLGIAGSLSVLAVGRIPSAGRERPLLAVSMLGIGIGIAAIVLFPHPLTVALAMLAIGVANGPFDVVLFTLRQRRTDPAWLGRAFAVSMALNFAGFPVGAALSGSVIPISLEAALVAAVALEAAAALLVFASIPRGEQPEFA